MTKNLFHRNGAWASNRNQFRHGDLGSRLACSKIIVVEHAGETGLARVSASREVLLACYTRAKVGERGARRKDPGLERGHEFWCCSGFWPLCPFHGF